MADLDVGVRIGIEGAAAANVLLQDLNKSLAELQKTGQITPIQSKELLGEFKTGTLKSFETELKSVAKEANLTSAQVDSAILHMRQGMEGLRSNRMPAADTTLPAVFRSNRGGSDIAATLATVAIQNKGMQEFSDRARDAAITQKRFTEAHAEAIVMNEAFDKALKKTGGSLSEVGGISKRTAQDFVQLGRAVAQGDITGAAMNVGQLAMAFKGGIPAIVGWVAAVAATLAPLAAYLKLSSDAIDRSREFNNALVASGNISGTTAESFNELTQSISNAGRLTAGTSREIATQLVSSGQFSAKAMQEISKLVEGHARLTGQEIKKATPDLIKMFTDPAKGAEELNKSIHFLNAAQKEHIESLVRQNRLEEAQVYLAKEYFGVLSKTIPELTVFEQLWDRITKNISAFRRDATEALKPPSLDSALDAARQRLVQLQDPSLGSPKKTEDKNALATAIAEEQALIRALETQIGLKKFQSTLDTERAKKSAEELRVQGQINQAATKQLRDLDDQIKAIRDTGAPSADKDQVLYELAVKRRNLMSQMGSESRAMSLAELEHESRTNSIAVQNLTDRLSARLNLGQIGQEQHDKELLGVQIIRNAVEQQLNDKKQKLAALQPLELENLKFGKIELQQQAELLKARRADLGPKFDKIRLDEENKALAEIYEQERKRAADGEKIASDFLVSQSEKLRQLDVEISLLGKSEVERKIALELIQQEIRFQKELAALQDANSVMDEEGNKVLRVTAAYESQVRTVIDVNAKMKEAVPQRIKILTEEEIRIKSIDSAMTSLGQTFSSAFEEALTGGKSLRDILKGIEQDLLRIGTRLLITEPFERGMKEALKSSDGTPGGILGAFGSKIGGWLGIGGGAGSVVNTSLAADIATSGFENFAALAASGAGFASGGSFTVGGSGGTDSQFVGFKASPDELVTVETPAQRRARSGNTSRSGLSINGPLMVINTPDANSFSRNMNQVSADMFALIASQQARFR